MAGQQEVTTMTEAKGTTTTSTTSASSLPSATDPDAISWLRTTLHSVDQRCSSLQTDLKKAQQVICFLINRKKCIFISNRILYLFIFLGLSNPGWKPAWISCLFG